MDKAQLLDDFRKRFSRDPEVVAVAPGRVNLIGEHIDYNDGFVLPMAIERNVVVAASRRKPETGVTTLRSTELDETVEIEIGASSVARLDGWGRYVEGVIAGFLSIGIPIPAFDAVVSSNIPMGSGLSSSAALEVAVATMLEGLTGNSIPPLEKALLCQKAEHDFVGVPCGIMDQFSSVFGSEGQLMLIDCRSNGFVLIPFDETDTTVLIINSNVQHELSGGEYAARRADCESALSKLGKESWRDVDFCDINSARSEPTEIEARRSKHVVSEMARTVEAAEAFRVGDFDQVGKLMYASHQSLRDDFEVSCSELDLLVEIANDFGSKGGVYGSRMTGGGFGGCTVSLVSTANLSTIAETIATRYQIKTGLRASWFASRPVQGARLMDVDQIQ